MPVAVVRQAHHEESLLLQIPDDLMAISPKVFPTADMQPVVVTIRGF